MKTKIFIIAAIMLVLVGSLSSCRKEKCEPFFLICNNSLSGLEGVQQQAVIIKTQEEWEDFKTLMNSAYYQGRNIDKETDLFSETDIDFEHYLIIAVIDEVRFDSSSRSTIKCIAEYSEKIVVTIQINSPEKGRFSTNDDRQPYHIVKIPETKKSVEFKYKK
jgi:hypothetical protein